MMTKESKSVNDVSPEQINKWIQEHQNNENTDAQDKLVNHYRKLIESLAYKYSKGQSHHEDLVQVGMVGLIGAINRFDLSFDRKFEAFLVPTVIGEIKRYLRDKTWSVHVPRRIKEIGPRIKKVSDELTNELERSPSIDEIAQRLEVSDEEVLEAMEMSQSYNALSVDHSIEADKDGSTVTLLDIMGQQDSNYDLTEKTNDIRKDSAYFIRTRTSNNSMYVYRGTKSKRNWRAHWFKPNACLSPSKNGN
jgi:RNA polymerase sigma-B factor